MNLTPHQVATRFMATEVEYINRLLASHDIDADRARTMLDSSAADALKHTETDSLAIVTDVQRNKATFYIV